MRESATPRTGAELNRRGEQSLPAAPAEFVLPPRFLPYDYDNNQSAEDAPIFSPDPPVEYHLQTEHVKGVIRNKPPNNNVIEAATSLLIGRAGAANPRGFVSEYSSKQFIDKHIGKPLMPDGSNHEEGSGKDYNMSPDLLKALLYVAAEGGPEQQQMDHFLRQGLPAIKPGEVPSSSLIKVLASLHISDLEKKAAIDFMERLLLLYVPIIPPTISPDKIGSDALVYSSALTPEQRVMSSEPVRILTTGDVADRTLRALSSIANRALGRYGNPGEHIRQLNLKMMELWPLISIVRERYNTAAEGDEISANQAAMEQKNQSISDIDVIRVLSAQLNDPAFLRLAAELALPADGQEQIPIDIIKDFVGSRLQMLDEAYEEFAEALSEDMGYLPLDSKFFEYINKLHMTMSPAGGGYSSRKVWGYLFGLSSREEQLESGMITAENSKKEAPTQAEIARQLYIKAWRKWQGVVDGAPPENPYDALRELINEGSFPAQYLEELAASSEPQFFLRVAANALALQMQDMTGDEEWPDFVRKIFLINPDTGKPGDVVRPNPAMINHMFDKNTNSALLLHPVKYVIPNHSTLEGYAVAASPTKTIPRNRFVTAGLHFLAHLADVTDLMRKGGDSFTATDNISNWLRAIGMEVPDDLALSTEGFMDFVDRLSDHMVDNGVDPDMVFKNLLRANLAVSLSQVKDVDPNAMVYNMDPMNTSGKQQAALLLTMDELQKWLILQKGLKNTTNLTPAEIAALSESARIKDEMKRRENIRLLPDILEELIDKGVLPENVSPDHPFYQLVVNMYNRLKEDGKYSALVLGPTGSGKTFTVDKIADVLVPDGLKLYLNLSNVTATGYKGMDLSERFASLVTNIMLNEGLSLEEAIEKVRSSHIALILDEVDKIFNGNTDSEISDFRKNVLNELLTLGDTTLTSWSIKVKDDKREVTFRLPNNRITTIFMGSGGEAKTSRFNLAAHNDPAHAQQVYDDGNSASVPIAPETIIQILTQEMLNRIGPQGVVDLPPHKPEQVAKIVLNPKSGVINNWCASIVNAQLRIQQKDGTDDPMGIQPMVTLLGADKIAEAVLRYCQGNEQIQLRASNHLRDAVNRVVFLMETRQPSKYIVYQKNSDGTIARVIVHPYIIIEEFQQLDKKHPNNYDSLLNSITLEGITQDKEKERWSELIRRDVYNYKQTKSSSKSQ